MGAATCTGQAPKSAPGTAVYRCRQPEYRVVYEVMQGHLESWLAGWLVADRQMKRVSRLLEILSRIFVSIGNAVSWPMDLPGRGVSVVVTVSSSLIPV